MCIDLIRPGVTLMFERSLPKGRGAPPSRSELARHETLNLLVVPTLPDVWESLRRALGGIPKNVFELGERPDRMQSGTMEAVVVPYRDGDMYYHEGNETVLSPEFTGCLMAVYTKDGRRRVVHVPTSSGNTDCKSAFRDLMLSDGYRLKQYFRPFVDSRHGAAQMAVIQALVKAELAVDPYCLTVLGITTAQADGNRPLSLLLAQVKGDSPGTYHVLDRESHAAIRDLKEFAGLASKSVLT